MGNKKINSFKAEISACQYQLVNFPHTEELVLTIQNGHHQNVYKQRWTPGVWRKDGSYQWEWTGVLEQVSKNEGKERQCLLSYFYSRNLANILTLADVTECGDVLSTEALP